MAAPHKDPRTGIFYFRRVIPAALRPFFSGSSSEYKRTLRTRDPAEARQRYPDQAVIYEQKLEAARRALTSQHLCSARSMVDRYLEGVSDQKLRGMAQKLASLEFGAFRHAHGLSAHEPGARYNFGEPPSLADLRDHADRMAMLEAVSDFSSLPWRETLQRIAQLSSLDPIEWAIFAIALHAGVALPPKPALHEAIGRAFLDRLCDACALKVEPARTRLIPPSVIVASVDRVADIGEVDRAQPAQVDKPAAATITEVFAAWATFEKREPKLIDEWRLAIFRFVALHGDLPVDRITSKMVREFKRVLSKLPSRAPKAIASLPILEQRDIAEAEDLPTLAPETVNKALSAVRVMLEHAKEELDLLEENVARGVRSLPRNAIDDPRLPFTHADMKLIFSAELPVKDDVPTYVIAWSLMLAAFTGCRAAELGTLRPSNIRRDDGIDFIAIEPDRLRVREKTKTPQKRLKTAAAKRDIPIHPLLIRAGFLDLVERRRDERSEWIFPNLPTNKYGSRGSRLSRVANDFLDNIGLSDPELVYHSFRHTGRRVLRGKVANEINDLLFGNANGSVSERYGRGCELATMHEAVKLIAYPEVDWQAFIERLRGLDCG